MQCCAPGRVLGQIGTLAVWSRRANASRIFAPEEQFGTGSELWIRIEDGKNGRSQGGVRRGGDTEIYRIPRPEIGSVLEDKVAKQVENGMRIALLQTRDRTVPDAEFDRQVTEHCESFREIRLR